MLSYWQLGLLLDKTNILYNWKEFHKMKKNSTISTNYKEMLKRSEDDYTKPQRN